MATTPAGWPYVQPADKPKEYPAVSQQLANKLQTMLPGPAAYFGKVDRTSAMTITNQTSPIVWQSFSGDSDQRSYTWTSSGITIPATGIYVGRLYAEVTCNTAMQQFKLEALNNGAGIDFGIATVLPAVGAGYRFETSIVRAFNAADVAGGQVTSTGTIPVTFCRLILMGPLANPPGV